LVALNIENTIAILGTISAITLLDNEGKLTAKVIALFGSANATCLDDFGVTNVEALRRKRSAAQFASKRAPCYAWL